MIIPGGSDMLSDRIYTVKPKITFGYDQKADFLYYLHMDTIHNDMQ
jgi:hypothetical protein